MMGMMIQQVTNNQKLSRPANTPVGTIVHVTDGFVVSGTAFEDSDGLYVDSGVLVGGRPRYVHINGEAIGYVFWNGTGWEGNLHEGGDGFLATDQDVPNPWDSTSGAVGISSLTHPAVQELSAPSTAQGGVFVSTLGIFLKSPQPPVEGGMEETLYNGKPKFGMLGGDYLTDFTHAVWVSDLDAEYELGPASPGWAVVDPLGEGFLYYSVSNVATPDLASNWKNASDDSPASITVTSVTVGELNAGLTVAGAGTEPINGVFPNTGIHNSAFYYSLLGVTGETVVNTISTEPENTWLLFLASGDVGYSGQTDPSARPAFPWVESGWDQVDGAAPAPTVTRNDVASEANWETQ